MRPEWIFNGIDGTTGAYLPAPRSDREIARAATATELDPMQIRELRWWTERHGISDPVRAPVQSGDPRELAQTGWGVIFAADVDPAVREALAPLLEHRRHEATECYRELVYEPGESKHRFLARHGTGPGPVDPATMPYYLLLVGDPRAIPFSFQYQIDVQYAVGRIHFGTPEEYFRYAEGVVRAEAYRTVSPRQQITFFGVRNPDDPVTERATEGLIRPLAQRLAMNMGGRYPVHTYLGSEAAKDQLHRLLGGNETPALLVTSCHGVRFPIGDPRQRSQQGALLCQDWPGPNAVSGELSHDYYLTADDIASDNARLSGLIAVFFSCYSAGTPTGDSFGHQISGQDERIAPYPFVSRLAQRLLGHPKGGALAVLGYVGRNLNLFEENDQISPFESSLRRLLDGTPVGHAMEYINQRYAELSVDLSELLWEAQYNQINLNARALSRVWRLSNDARSFILLGDPAVRLMAGQPRPGASPDHNPRSTTHPSRTELV